MDISCARAYVELDKAGYDQLPTVSNWETPDNIYNTMKFCLEHCSREHLKGFLLAPWKPTLEMARERHMDAIDHFASAARQLQSGPNLAPSPAP
jgi:hypothetical protein